VKSVDLVESCVGGECDIRAGPEEASCWFHTVDVVLVNAIRSSIHMNDYKCPNTFKTYSP